MFNKSEICRTANELTKQGYSKSDAFKMAWAEAKATVSAPLEVKEDENTAGTTIAAKAREFKQIQKAIEDLEAQAATIKESIISDMGEAEEVTADIFKIRYITIISNRLDTSKLKKEHTDLYNAYLKESTAKRFTVMA